MKKNEKTQSDLINDLGFNKSAVSTWCNGTRLPRMDKVELLAQYFKISRSDLMEEKSQDNSFSLTARDERDIEKIINQTREKLVSQEGLMFDGDPASPEAIDSILSAMQIGMELAKKKNKERFTPRKYKKG
ncbi:MAG: helix-turn-helix transcriptional regulator [Lachnospiraceae bacterium]|nr:helix-turn-helix transcriptional regulator [Lachnospiraceae bacterium]